MSNPNLEVKVNAFLNAVELLFHSNNTQQKKKANKFIIELEKNSDSWDVSFQILQRDNLQEEIYFNALQILKNKIKFDFGNFIENPIYIQNLLNFFESNIDKFKKAKNYLLINYCDCIGKAFLFTGDKFKEILIKFINKLSGQNSDINGLICLLLIFNYISENCHDEKIVIDKKSREQIISYVKNIAGDVFQFIIFLINRLDENDIKNNLSLKKFISSQILETIINYINFPLNEETMLKFNNEYFPIVNFIFQIKEENLEKQSDCICSLLTFPLQKENMNNLTQYIFSKIISLKDIFYKSFNIIDNEQINFYIDVFTNFVGNNLNEILLSKKYELIKIIIDMIKKCPVLKIDVILDFFGNLNEIFEQNNLSINDINKNIPNLFQDLIKNLIILTKFDDDVFKKLNISKLKALKDDDEYNNTLDYRHSIKNFLEDFCNIYGFNYIFNDIIYQEFNNIILNIKQNQKDISSWCKLENILYILSCIIIILDIKKEENNKNILINLNTLFYTILEIPKEFVHIIRTITELLENCPKEIFIEKELLLKIFKFLVNELDNKLLLKYCSRSAKSFLINNKKSMSEYKKDLMVLYNDKLKNNALMNEKYIDIIEGLIEVVCYCDNNNISKNDDVINTCIIEIMKPWVIYLKDAKKLIENNDSKISKDQYDSLNQLLIILKYTSKSIFEGINESYINIMNEIFKEIYPEIMFIFNKNITDSDIVENIIQFLKIFIKGLTNNFIQYIPNFIECLIFGYKTKPISSYLYGYEILISVFPTESSDSIKTILNNAFNNFCQITLHGYIKNKSNDEDDILDIISDFYGLLYRILKKNPTILLDSDLIDEIIKSSLDNLNLDDIEISKNIISFLSRLISYEDLQYFQNIKKNNINIYQKYKNIIHNKLENNSLLLCEKILSTYLQVPAESIIEYITDLFKDFITYQKNLVINSMNNYIKNISNDILTNKEKEEFIFLIQNFKMKENSEKEFDEFINNFENRCESKQIRDKGESQLK